MINYLPRDKIDDQRWNDCVYQSANSFPYGYTWYLDNACENWDSLIFKDYEAVFPLVWKKKFTIYYLYQPFFTQQLGIFSRQPMSHELMRSFIDAIPSRFRYIQINLNFLNKIEHPQYQLTPRTNYYLDLHHDYEVLSKAYSQNTKRNVRKSKKNSLIITGNIAPETIIAFFKSNVGNRLKEIKDYHYNNLLRIIYKSIHYDLGQTLGVFDEKNQLLSTGFFIQGKNKIINILPATNDEGKKTGAGFMLIDHIIESNAGHSKTLDFEGSMIESIASFYKD